MTNGALSMSQTVTASKLDLFLEEAYRSFNLYSEKRRGKKNQFYLDVPVRLSRGRMGSNDGHSSAAYELTNALIFLTGIETRDTTPFTHQSIADAPSVSFVVGQYGLGKTELVFHVCHHMENSVERPLPVNLGVCRAHVSLLNQKPTDTDMMELLFGRILDVTGLARDYQFVADSLLPEVRQGNVMLILDGLDELISNQVQHHNFFSGLMSLLAGEAGGGGGLPLFRVVISMRFEYLSSFSNKDATDLVHLVGLKSPAGRPISTYFLVLDYLGDTRVNAYLHSRLKVENAFEKLKNHSSILDMLRRPLLLKIFCDMVEDKHEEFDRIINDLKTNANPSRLLGLFVKMASDDRSLNVDQENLTAFTWDSEKLADTSLQLYRNGESEMRISDIKTFLKPSKEGLTDEDINKLSNDEVLKSIHKCPFLKQESISADDDSAYVVRFAHRIFFEYFTAKAIASELNDADVRATTEIERKRAFDELVLNVDMRKFLRGLVDRETWIEETAKSYGLHNKDEWEPCGGVLFKTLDEQRQILLNLMTEPEKYHEDAKKAVRWFLNRQTSWLHPRYLIYNYEAVAVYLWYNRWQDETKQISTEFSDILWNRLLEIQQDLSLGEAKLKKPKQLLLERILHIGQRLRYKWAEKFNEKDKQDPLLSVIDAEDIKNRIRAIFNDIENSVF